MSRTRKWFPTDKTCPVCSSVWRATSNYQIRIQEFCSRACRTKIHGNGRSVSTTKRNCKYCEKEMQVLPCHLKTKWFCSKSCSSRFHNQGEGNPAWKGGDARGKYWKRQARKRDSYTCQFPSCERQSRGKGTHAHHKVPRSVGGEDALENLITLCSKHHREVERLLFKSMLAHCHRENPGLISKLVSEIYSW